MKIWLSVAFLAFAACSSDKGPKYPDTNSFCNGRAQAECSGEVIKSCAVADATHCIASRQAKCVMEIPAGTSYNPAGAEACINTVSAAYADAKVTQDENHTMITSCTVVFAGVGAVNATCTKDIDCNVGAGLRCVVGGGATTGMCEVPETVQGGGSCAAISQLCIDGYHCGASKHCDINGQVDEACTDALPCSETTQCVAGMCAKKLDDGTACAKDGECLHGICARGMSAAQGLCVSQVTLAPNEPFCVDAR